MSTAGMVRIRFDVCTALMPVKSKNRREAGLILARSLSCRTYSVPMKAVVVDICIALPLKRLGSRLESAKSGLRIFLPTKVFCQPHTYQIWSMCYNEYGCTTIIGRNLLLVP